MEPVLGPCDIPLPRPSMEECRSIASCNTESVRYMLECCQCRLKRLKRYYIGESSRSAHHYFEEHQGRRRKVLMRVLSRHRTAVDKQVWDSILIEKGLRDSVQCLNGKSEWGGSKLPKI